MTKRIAAAILMGGLLILCAVGQQRASDLVPDGWRALQADDLVLARRRFARAAALNPQDARAHEGLARVAAREGDRSEAVGHYETALRLSPTTARLHVAVARLLSDMRDHGRAVEHLRTAVGLDPDDAEAWRSYALALWRVEWYPQAADAYERAIALDAENAWAYVGLGDTRLREGKLDEALAAYQNAIERDDEAYAAYCGKGAALSKQGKFGAAIQSLQHAIDLRADYAPAYYEAGVALQHRKDYKNAIRAFAKATELNGWDASSLMNIARCYGRLGEREMAKKAHAQALKLQEAQTDLATARAYIAQYPDKPDGYVGLATVYGGMGRRDEAISAYKQALDRDAGSIAARSGLADLYLRVGMLPEAADAHRTLIALRPTDIETRVMFGTLLRELGEDEEGLVALRKAHAMAAARVADRGHADDWNVLAYVLYAQARYGRAEDAMREAIRLNPIEPSYAGRLADIRAAMEASR